MDPGLQVTTVHNAGVTKVGGDTVMLFRSHLRCGKSVLGLARSTDGVTNWRIDPSPALLPATADDQFAQGVDIAQIIENEAGGVEDPRITAIDDSYAITYSAYHAEKKNRVRVSLAVTKDFKQFTRYGPMLESDMRNVVLFPEKIGGKYVALMRPNDVTEGDVGGVFTRIRIAYSDDWRAGRWTVAPRPILQTGHGPSAFSDKIGPGAPPLKTDRGWINLFHGVRTTMDGNPYVLGVALHDLDAPSRLRVSSIPIVFPSKSDCRTADEDYVHVPNVVFTCGAIDSIDGSILVYYGGNDTVMNVGITHSDVLIALCERYAQDPLSGTLRYRPGRQEKQS
jgi:predicted GH43/DUF377 family glycosyl hydrolase